jgi:hypothetical protein
MMTRTMKIGLVAAATVLLAACATQPAPPIVDLPGFFMGLWHGAIAPLALVAGWFSDIRMYAFPNSGGWYDFGFLIGLSAIWGGGGVAVTRR